MAFGGPHRGGPDFAQPVGRHGYAWWYVDALSDDNCHGLTIIAFIGSVFSPYYAQARRRGDGDPENHVALNVALYGAGGKRWTMTERGRSGLDRDATTLAIGPSSLNWDGRCLTIEINEIASPVPRRVRGTVKLYPSAIVDQSFALDAAGDHHWRPIAPFSRVHVKLDEPRIAWSGGGYFDTNAGRVPLEQTFKRWDWSRASGREGTAVLYDVTLRDGAERGLAMEIAADGTVGAIAPPPAAALPATAIWRIPRITRGDAGEAVRIIDTLEDTPFYSRSILSSSINGTRRVAMHESLSLERFCRPIVQVMLPFRMPRRATFTPGRRSS